MPIPSPNEALSRLREGNFRYKQGSAAGSRLAEADGTFKDLSAGQEPFAAVLGCADSRVPVEVVFDQGAGQLFVVRVAGNVPTLSPRGSLEFAVEELGVPLILVLGHTRCGAVAATLGAPGADGRTPTPGLAAITDRISAALAGVAPLTSPPGPAEIDRAVRLNVEASCRALMEESEVLGAKVRAGQLRIVGAVYHLHTGVVEFLEGISAES
jgi:carbonic anhydrase